LARRRSLYPHSFAKEAGMDDDRKMIDNGPSDRPVNETIAGTGPGIPDDSLAPGEEELPEAPSDEEVEKVAKELGAPTAEKDTLPLEGE
jgi:hypothetical protein